MPGEYHEGNGMSDPFPAPVYAETVLIHNFEDALEAGRDDQCVARAGFGRVALFIDDAAAAFQHVEVLVLIVGKGDAPAAFFAGPDAGADLAAGVGEVIPGAAFGIAFQPAFLAWMVVLGSRGLAAEFCDGWHGCGGLIQ